MTIKSLLSLLMCSLMLLACGEDERESPIPYVYVYVELNVNQLQYDDLRTKGYIYVPGGVRGLVVLAERGGNYKAFDRNCPFQPNDACALVEVDPSGFFMIDHCCSSTFDLEGFPTGGPARSIMRKYATQMEGNVLIITSQPL